MKKEEIKKLYKKKIIQFKKNNYLYFEKNAPKINDADFDQLKIEILELEKKFSFLKSQDSPSKVLGFKPSKNFNKVSHKKPMLSLANAFSEEDLKNFEKKIFNFLDHSKNTTLEYSAEPKIDGISASLFYKNGEFVQGLSRGDGKEGEDITANLKTIKDIPKKINSKNFPEEIDIRGEVFIQNSDFENIKKKFANPRNAASGTLRQKNPEDTKKIPLKFIAYTYGYEKGNVANAPRWAIAHKFSANKGVSKILDIDIQVGRTGALTPVAKIKPINIGGVVVSNATLHNEDEIVRKDIRINDIAVIERAGDVIPHIISVDKEKREKNSKRFNFPVNCPSCGSKTVKEFNNLTKKEDSVRRCSSEGFECEKVSVEKLKHFVSKEAFNIDGLGKKIVENFWALKLIRLPQDIFSLNFDKIEKLDGWGKLSISNLKYSIQERTNISFERFIYSLGIRHIGLENAKLISKSLKKSSNFLSLSKDENFEELLNIDGIGETQINSIKNFFSNKTNLKIVNELINLLNINEAQTIKKDGVLANKTFMLTGKLNGISRAEAKSLIEENSGSIVSNVSKKLDYLIVGEKPTKRKVESAKKLKIKILNQQEWSKILNKSS